MVLTFDPRNDGAYFLVDGVPSLILRPDAKVETPVYVRPQVVAEVVMNLATLQVFRAFNMTVTREGTANYIATFGTPLVDGNYALGFSVAHNYGVRAGGTVGFHSNAAGAQVDPTTTGFRFYCYDAGGAVYNPTRVTITVTR